jgi:hypothetical protein
MLVEEGSASSTDAIDFDIFSEVRLIPEFSISMEPWKILFTVVWNTLMEQQV